jgi:hypothetical protein
MISNFFYICLGTALGIFLMYKIPNLLGLLINLWNSIIGGVAK